VAVTADSVVAIGAERSAAVAADTVAVAQLAVAADAVNFYPSL